MKKAYRSTSADTLFRTPSKNRMKMVTTYP